MAQDATSAMNKQFSGMRSSFWSYTAMNEHQRRQSVQSAVDGFFGTQVACEERVYQILEDLLRTEDDQTYALLWAVVSRVPSFASLLIEMGVSLEEIWCPPLAIRQVSADTHISSVLGQALLDDFFDPTTLNTTARRIQESGRLGLVDLITGVLESPFNWPDNVPQTLLSSIILARGEDPRGLSRADIRALATQLGSTFRQFSRFDTSLGDQQFLLTLEKDVPHIRPFASFSLIGGPRHPHDKSSFPFHRSSVVEPTTRFSVEALTALEALISRNAPERDFQNFFEHHDEFLLALGEYSTIHPQLVLVSDRRGGLVPDFFLEKLSSDYCDICDLKRPTSDFVRYQKNRTRFRDAVMEGLAQLRQYRDWFEDERNREAFHRQYALRGYRPQAILILGRRQAFRDEIERIRLESDLPAWVTLKTYDDIFERATQWRKLTADSRR